MGTVCLSLVSVLRCVGFSHIQGTIVFIPPVLGLIFAVSLLVIKRHERSYWLLAAEGVLYSILATLDYVSHVIPATRTSISTFKSFDIVVGAVAFVPLFCYVLFLFFFVRFTLLPDLTVRFRRIVMFTLALFLPVILISSAIGSFIGISYSAAFFPGTLHSTVVVGFNDGESQFQWIFFQSLALALLMAYQALVFCLAFHRLVRVFIDQRRIESSQAADHQAYLFRGTGWIAIGLKLGAVESVVGFAQQDFGMALTRVVLRMLSRACLVIGLIRGMDTLEDFNLIDIKRRSLRMPIGISRYSTFGLGQQLQNDSTAALTSKEPDYTQARTAPAPYLPPSMTEAQVIASMQRLTYNPFTSPRRSLASSSKRDSPASSFYSNSHGAVEDWSRLPSAPGDPTPRASAYTTSTGDRVTINYDAGGTRAPRLQVRLSRLDLDVSSPGTLAESLGSSMRLQDIPEWVVPAAATGALGEREERRRAAKRQAKHERRTSITPSAPVPALGALGLIDSPLPFTNFVPVAAFSSQTGFTSTDADSVVIRPVVQQRERSATPTTVNTDASFSRRLSNETVTSFETETEMLSPASDTSDFVSELASRFPAIPTPPARRASRRNRDRVKELSMAGASSVSPFADPPGRRTTSARETAPRNTRSNISSHSRFKSDTAGLERRPSSSVYDSELTPGWARHLRPSVPELTPTFAITPALGSPRTDYGSGVPVSLVAARVRKASVDDSIASLPRTRAPALLSPGPARTAAADVPVSALDSPKTSELFSSARPGKSGPGTVGLVKVKSVGVAPLRDTPVATTELASRESVPLEHFFIEVRKDGTGQVKRGPASVYGFAL